MSFNTESDEVADDYRRALEDLTGNLKYEINNLTMIARESTEHAHSIADAIIEHILKVAPHKKLPALYVLDSIAKNVGSPYTIFFGNSLYKIFMESYAMVDQNTRRKMVEMLRTWKEPVPGSIDPRPVFEPEFVAPIDAALMKVLGPGSGGRVTQSVPSPVPTPPGRLPRQQSPYGVPPSQFPLPVNGGSQRPCSQSHAATPHVYPPPVAAVPDTRSTPQPSFSSASHEFYRSPLQSSVPGQVDLRSLLSDITALIEAMKIEAVQKPHDLSVQTKLGALRDLQSILQTQQDLPQDQLILVKKQVADLAMTIAVPAPHVAAGVLVPQSHRPHPQTPTPPSLAAAATQYAPPPLPQRFIGGPVVAESVGLGESGGGGGASKPSLSSLLGPNAMAAIMKAQSQKQSVKPRTPPVPHAHLLTAAVPNSPSAPSSHGQMTIRAPTPQTSLPQKDPMMLIGLLRSKGLLGKSTSREPQTWEEAASSISLNSQSLKQFRPYLSKLLTDKLGKPCTKCGRRFSEDEEGRAKKMAHMDWHFKVNQRMKELEQREQHGLHMCLYVDELEWIRWEEAIDADYHLVQASRGNTGGGSGIASGGKISDDSTNKIPLKEQWIRVPDDTRLKASVCPICQEKFQTSWLDEAQEFVWMDAVKVGDRVFHATCHAEAFGGREHVKDPLQQIGRNTPDRVLGKRKAEDDHSSRIRPRLGVY